MLSHVVLVFLFAAPTPPIALAAPGLQLVGLEASLQDAYTDRLAQQLRFQGLEARSASDVAAVLGLERQKQLLGCSDDSCKAELGSLLGVDGLVLGTVTKLERSYTMDVRVVSSGRGQVLAQASAQASDEEGLARAIAVVAEQLARQTAARLGRALTSSASTRIVRGPTVVRRSWWIPGVVGLAGLAAGGVGLGLAVSGKSWLDAKHTPPLSSAQWSAKAAEVKQAEQWGWVGVGVGAAAVVAAVLMYVLGGDEVVTAGVALAPGRASFLVGVVFP